MPRKPKTPQQKQRESRRIALPKGWSHVTILEAEHAARIAPMLAAYERLTGFHETNPMAIWHHRVSL